MHTHTCLGCTVRFNDIDAILCSLSKDGETYLGILKCLMFPCEGFFYRMWSCLNSAESRVLTELETWVFLPKKTFSSVTPSKVLFGIRTHRDVQHFFATHEGVKDRSTSVYRADKEPGNSDYCRYVPREVRH